MQTYSFSVTVPIKGRTIEVPVNPPLGHNLGAHCCNSVRPFSQYSVSSSHIRPLSAVGGGLSNGLYTPVECKSRQLNMFDPRSHRGHSWCAATRPGWLEHLEAWRFVQAQNLLLKRVRPSRAVAIRARITVHPLVLLPRRYPNYFRNFEERPPVQTVKSPTSSQKHRTLMATSSAVRFLHASRTSLGSSLVLTDDVSSRCTSIPCISTLRCYIHSAIRRIKPWGSPIDVRPKPIPGGES